MVRSGVEPDVTIANSTSLSALRVIHHAAEPIAVSPAVTHFRFVSTLYTSAVLANDWCRIRTGCFHPRLLGWPIANSVSSIPRVSLGPKQRFPHADQSRRRFTDCDSKAVPIAALRFLQRIHRQPSPRPSRPRQRSWPTRPAGRPSRRCRCCTAG